MHSIIPNFAVRIDQGMCFRKRLGPWFENVRVEVRKTYEITLSTTDGTIQTRFNATLLRPILREHSSSDHSQTFCAYTSGNVLSESGGGGLLKMHGWR